MNNTKIKNTVHQRTSSDSMPGNIQGTFGIISTKNFKQINSFRPKDIEEINSFISNVRTNKKQISNTQKYQFDELDNTDSNNNSGTLISNRVAKRYNNAIKIKNIKKTFMINSARVSNSINFKRSISYDHFIAKKHLDSYSTLTKHTIPQQNYASTNIKSLFYNYNDFLVNKNISSTNKKISLKYKRRRLSHKNNTNQTYSNNATNHNNIDNSNKSGNSIINHKTIQVNPKSNSLSKKVALISERFSIQDKQNLISKVIDVNKYNFKNISTYRPLKAKNIQITSSRAENQDSLTNNYLHNKSSDINVIYSYKELSKHYLNQEQSRNYNPDINTIYDQIKIKEKEEKTNVSKIIDQLLSENSKIKSKDDTNKLNVKIPIDEDEYILKNNIEYTNLNTTLNYRNPNFIDLKNAEISDPFQKHYFNKHNSDVSKLSAQLSSTSLTRYELDENNTIVNKINCFPIGSDIKIQSENLIDPKNMIKNPLSKEPQEIQNPMKNYNEGNNITVKTKIILYKNPTYNGSNNILRDFMKNSQQSSKLNKNEKNMSSRISDASVEVLKFGENKNNLIQTINLIPPVNENDRNTNCFSSFTLSPSPEPNNIPAITKKMNKVFNDDKSNKTSSNNKGNLKKSTPNLMPLTIVEEKQIKEKKNSSTNQPQANITNINIIDVTPKKLKDIKKINFVEKLLFCERDDLKEQTESKPPKIKISPEDMNYGNNKITKLNKNMTERKNAETRNKTSAQMNNFQNIINNNLTFFNSNYTNSAKTESKTNLILEEESEKHINKNGKKTLKNKLKERDHDYHKKTEFESTLPMTVAANSNNTKITLKQGNEKISKNKILMMNSANNSIYHKDSNIKSDKDNNINLEKTTKNFPILESLKYNYNYVSFDKSLDDECSLSGEEKAQITSVPLFNNKKLENYNFASNKNGFTMNKHINNKKNFNRISISEHLNTLFKYHFSVKELLLSFLLNKEVLNFSFASKLFYKESQYKIFSFVINLILNKNNTSRRLKIWKSIYQKSSLSKLKYLKKEYLDNLYKKSPYEEEIKKDLNRTFPDDPTFKPGNINYKKLFNILIAYSNFNSKIGYAQGLNFIVANAILILNEEEEVFIFIDALINKYSFYNLIGIDNSLIRKKLDEIGCLLQKYTPRLVEFLEENMLNHEFFTTNWLITIFANSVNKQNLFKIWDFFVIYGWKFINYFIVSIMLTFKNDIMENDPNLLSTNIKLLLKSDKFDSFFQHIIFATFEMMAV